MVTSSTGNCLFPRLLMDKGKYNLYFSPIVVGSWKCTTLIGSYFEHLFPRPWWLLGRLRNFGRGVGHQGQGFQGYNCPLLWPLCFLVHGAKMILLPSVVCAGSFGPGDVKVTKKPTDSRGPRLQESQLLGADHLHLVLFLLEKRTTKKNHELKVGWGLIDSTQ